MAIKTALICADDSATAIYAICYFEGLSLTFQFSRDPHHPLSMNSRIATYFHEIEVTDENETYPDAESMGEAMRSSVAYVWPFCAVHPSAHFPDVIVHIQQDIHNKITWSISHESTYQKYVEALLSTKSVQDSIVPHANIKFKWISQDSLQYLDVIGGRGSSAVVRLNKTPDNKKYVFKGLNFCLFRESTSGFHSKRDTFYRELAVIFRLPDHPNLLRTPSMLVTTEGPYSRGQKSERRVCGALYPYLDRQSLQEVIEKAELDKERIPLILKARWAFQISSAMLAVHVARQFHMDLQPSNILLDGQDDVVVIDWKQVSASPIFLAPEADGTYDVEVVSSDQTTGTHVGVSSGELRYRKYTGPPPENSRTWPRRNVFTTWRSKCPRALEAAEMYSLGKTLWAAFSQNSERLTESHQSSFEAELDAWMRQDSDIPQSWKNFVAHSTDLDPNKRGKFDDTAEFWHNELMALISSSS